MKTTIAMLFLLLCAAPAVAQSPAAQREAMKKFDWWVGVWEGEGWTLGPDGQRRPFKIRETIQSKLDGQVLLVEGVGTAKGADGAEGVVHNALGLLSFDSKAQRYRFLATTTQGGYGETEMKVIEGGYQWGMPTPNGGSFRYTIRLMPSGEWHEFGEWSRDGATWSKFHDMTLRRVK